MMAAKRCQHCDGGKFTVILERDGRIERITRDCPACKGSGFAPLLERPSPRPVGADLPKGEVRMSGLRVSRKLVRTAAGINATVEEAQPSPRPVGADVPKER
jgi:hypothetical protein